MLNTSLRWMTHIGTNKSIYARSSGDARSRRSRDSAPLIRQSINTALAIEQKVAVVTCTIVVGVRGVLGKHLQGPTIKRSEVQTTTFKSPVPVRKFGQKPFIVYTLVLNDMPQNRLTEAYSAVHPLCAQVYPERDNIHLLFTFWDAWHEETSL